MGIIRKGRNIYEVYLGVDIGQSKDSTAVVVVDPERRNGDTHYIVRFLKRMPLGTPYPAIVQEIKRIYENIPNPNPESKLHKRLWVDATGVGKPVVDLIRREISGVLIHEVFLTGGEAKENISAFTKQISLPKAFLVSKLQVLLSCGRVHLPRNSESEALRNELMNYTIRVNENANAEFGAFKVGSHDDIVTALGLACLSEGLPETPKIIVH